MSTRGKKPHEKTAATKAKPAKTTSAKARASRAATRLVVDPAELAAKKLASPAQLLFRVARRLDQHALSRVEAKTGIALRPAHTALFPHVDLEGTRPTEIARRLGVTKQAVHPLVEELVELGVFERVPDPSDARATLVRWSNRRGRSLLDGLAVLGELERELGTVVGVRRLAGLASTLREIDAWLDRAGATG